MPYSISVNSRSSSGASMGPSEQTISKEPKRGISEANVLNGTCFLLWRLFAGCYCGCILIWSTVNSNYEWFMYLTHWSLLLTAIYLISVLVLTVNAQCFQEKIQKLSIYSTSVMIIPDTIHYSEFLMHIFAVITIGIQKQPYLLTDTPQPSIRSNTFLLLCP